MDYVLFGMGYGASLMLIGWALRTFGPQFKYSESAGEESTEYQVARRFWVRFIQGLGGVIALAGVALVFLTFVVMLVNPDDGTGTLTALVVWAFILVALLAWCWMYVGRFGLTGIWSRTEGFGLRKRNTASAPSSLTRAPRKRLGTTEPSADAALTTTTSTEVYPADTSAESAPEPTESGETSVDIHIGPDDPRSAYDFGEVASPSLNEHLNGRTAALRRLRERSARTEADGTPES